MKWGRMEEELVEKSSWIKHITEMNGRSWERQRIVAFYTWQWNEWLDEWIQLLRHSTSPVRAVTRYTKHHCRPADGSTTNPDLSVPTTYCETIFSSHSMTHRAGCAKTWLSLTWNKEKRMH
jgi:hypothetical protein